MKSSMPYDASSARTCAVTVGWLTCSARAPAVKPPWRATAKNERRWARRIDCFYESAANFVLDQCARGHDTPPTARGCSVSKVRDGVDLSQSGRRDVRQWHARPALV